MKPLAALMIILTLALATAGCANPASQPASQTAEPTYAPVIDPANFVIEIDNPYFPLKPGTVFIYDGTTEKGSEHVEVQILTETKVIQGVVTCVTVLDTVTVDGKLEEVTYDWYAQDKQGNVWYFGEDSKEYDENGNAISTKGSWVAGVDGAYPGIIMEADPKVGDAYRQEYYPGEAEDMATVLSLSESATIPYASYKDMLMTQETTPLEPALIENKYYAKGVGFVLMTAPKESYRLELVEIRQP